MSRWPPLEPSEQSRAEQEGGEGAGHRQEDPEHKLTVTVTSQPGLIIPSRGGLNSLTPTDQPTRARDSFENRFLRDGQPTRLRQCYDTIYMLMSCRQGF